MAESRHRNGILKAKERQRRDARMLELVRTGKPPYTPAVQSWLSAQLDKPARQITPEEVQGLLASK
jgi:hypothetical protein